MKVLLDKEFKEIKEILRYLKIENGHCSSELSYKETHILLDYITNLQEENKTLKELNVCVGCNNNPDYKKRIDKALEYIEEHKRNVYDTFGEGIVFGEMGGIKEIIKILKGEEND